MPESLMYAFKFKRPEKGSVVPALFIGLGGAGGRLVDRVLAKLEDRWDNEKFRNLYHAFAIDTDRGELDERRRIPEPHRIHISDFDKRAYIREKRGETHVEADPHVTSWVHPWYGFRSESGAGAGQIRIESRLCMHQKLENDRAGLIAALNDAIDDILNHDNVYRRKSSLELNVFMYGSLAGGTGSGAFLLTAYLVRKLAEARGLQPRIYAYAILPGPFIEAVAFAQREGVDANGYAALKEIEYLMGLGVEGAGRPAALPFRYSGFHRGETEVRAAPFDFVWLLDVPRAFSAGGLDALREAVADAMFVQFSTPVHRSQASNWDNMVRLVQGGTAEKFSLKFGTYGASALVLPDRELLAYLARRVALDNLDRFVLLRSGAATGRMSEILKETQAALNTQGFEALDPRAQDAAKDKAFRAFIDAMAEDEREQHRSGPFRAIRDGVSALTGGALTAVIEERLGDLVRRITANVNIDPVAANELSRMDFATEPRFAKMRGQLEISAQNVEAALQQFGGRVSSGRMLREIFSEHSVSPLGQRYLLIGLRDALRERLDALRAELGEGPRLRTEDHTGSLESFAATLTKTEPLTWKERFFQGGENRDFNEARRAFASWCGELAGDADAWVRRDAERRLVEALLVHVSRRLETFRGLEDATYAQRRALQKDAEDRRRGGLVGGGGSAFALDTEVLRDDRTKERLWDRYYDRYIRPNPLLSSPDRVFQVMARAMADAAAETPEALIAAISAAFIADAESALAPDITGRTELSNERADLGLLIDDALRIEAELILSNGSPSEKDIAAHIAHKLRFAGGKSALLATLRDDGDPQVNPDDFRLVCAHPAYQGDGRLGRMLSDALEHDGFENVAYGWDDPKAVFIYRARLGMPAYWFEPVPRRMKSAYHAQQRTAVASQRYPLHIDSSWEAGLPELDPMTRQQDAARREEEARHVGFALLVAVGVIQREASEWRLVMHGLGEETLGAGFEASFEAVFKTMPFEKQQLVMQRIEDTRSYLEGPEEPAEAWRDYSAYLAEVAKEAFQLLGKPQVHPCVTHWRHLSAWLRRCAPADALQAASDILAPESDG